MAYKLAFHTYSAILASLFYTYSATVDSFVTVFFLKNITFRSLIVDCQACQFVFETKFFGLFQLHWIFLYVEKG